MNVHASGKGKSLVTISSRVVADSTDAMDVCCRIIIIMIISRLKMNFRNHLFMELGRWLYCIGKRK